MSKDDVSKWYWCNHPVECHYQDKAKSRRHPRLWNIFIIRTASSGWKTHALTHTCNPPCINPERLPVTHTQFITYANALHEAALSSSSKTAIIEQYKQSWEREYPNDPVPLTDKGFPANFENATPPFNRPSTDNQRRPPPSQGQTHEPAPRSTGHPSGGPSLGSPLPSSASRSAISGPISFGSAQHTAFPHGVIPPAPPALAPSFPPRVQPSRSHGPLTPQLPGPSQVRHSASGGRNAEPVSHHDQLQSALQQRRISITNVGEFPLITGGLIPMLNLHLQPPKPLTVVFVELPEHRLHPGVEDTSTNVARTEIDNTAYECLRKCMPHSVRRLPPGPSRTQKEGHTWVVVPSIVLIALEMMEHPRSWDVELVSWEFFYDTVIRKGESGDRSEALWSKLIYRTDLIVGGYDFEGDFLNTNVNMWNIGLKETMLYIQHSSLLHAKTAIWVHPTDLHLGGMKQETAYMLTQCAMALGYEHPISAHIHNKDLMKTVEEMEKGKRHGVLKRSYSSLSQHVITPNTKLPIKAVEKAHKEYLKFWDKVPRECNLAKPSWMFQPFHHLLLYLGELRTVIVNGSIFYTVSTVTGTPSDPSDIMTGIVRTTRPLNAFGFDPKRPTDPEATGWMSIEGGDSFDPRELGKNTYTEYVLKMLGMMVEAEEIRYKRFSGLRIFARMDVSVFRHQPSGEYRYFVNEVTRSNSTHLFQHQAGINMDHMITYLVKVLRHCVVHKLLLPKDPQ